MISITKFVMARLDRAIHLSLAPIAITITLAAPANAAPLEKTHYDATMAALSDIQSLMLGTIDAIHESMSPEEARTRLPHLTDRLQWMRDAKVEAARADTAATLRSMNDENRRARCIVMRAGLMDEHFQDIVVDVTLKARGVADAELLPLERKPVEEFGSPSSCPR